MPEVVLELQPDLRPELKEPMGRLYTEAAALLAAAGDPIVTVGDIVTYHLIDAGHTPDVALIDRRTERSAVDDEIEAGIEGFDRVIHVENPPATLTADLLGTLGDAIEGAADGTTLIEVNGEEDLATLPAILVVPAGGSVVYGQPGRGMVLVDVDRDSRTRARDLLRRMDGDSRRLFAVLDVE